MARKRGSMQGTRETSLMESVVELLHSSPVDDGLICCDRVISHIDNGLKELKQFINNVVSNNVNIRTHSDENTQQQDNLDKTQDNSPSNPVYKLEQMIGDLLLEIVPLNPVVEEILREINSWDWDAVRVVRDRIMELTMYERVRDIKADIQDLKKNVSALMSDKGIEKTILSNVRDVVRSIKVLEDKIDEISTVSHDLTSKLNDMHLELSQLEIQTYQTLLTESDAIKRLMKQYHDASNTWFNTIYDKLLECCVRDEVVELLQKSDVIQSDIDYVKSRLDGAPSARQQAVEGETRSQLKAIQAQLAEIRGLL